jgi:hypothetical protein
MDLKQRFGLFMIDLVIKLIICRAYLNIKAKKLLTAEKILDTAKILISKHAYTVYHEYHELKREQVTTLKSRPELPIIPLTILKQKYLLHKGHLMLTFNREKDAIKYFTHCMKTGEVIDFRIKKDCLL